MAQGSPSGSTTGSNGPSAPGRSVSGPQEQDRYRTLNQEHKTIEAGKNIRAAVQPMVQEKANSPARVEGNRWHEEASEATRRLHARVWGVAPQPTPGGTVSTVMAPQLLRPAVATTATPPKAETNKGYAVETASLGKAIPQQASVPDTAKPAPAVQGLIDRLGKGPHGQSTKGANKGVEAEIGDTGL